MYVLCIRGSVQLILLKILGCLFEFYAKISEIPWKIQFFLKDFPEINHIVFKYSKSEHTLEISTYPVSYKQYHKSHLIYIEAAIGGEIISYA